LPLPECLVAGSWSPGPDQLVVGSEWARANRAELGTEVNLLAPQQFKDVLSGKGVAGAPKKIPLPRTFRVAGILQRECLSTTLSMSLPI